MYELINNFVQDESGPTMVEYGLLVVLIALVVALGAVILGQKLSGLFSSVGSYVGAVPVPTAP
jgi:Flp pilus assembly pilin Flp